MVSRLQDLCYQKIASTMHEAPPLLQEMIMGATGDYFKSQLRTEIKKEVEEEIHEKAYNDIMETVPLLVPEIMDDIIESMTQNGRMRQDFRMIYAHLSPYAVSCAIETAEHAVRNMEDKYIHNAFRNNTPNGHESDYSLSSLNSDSDSLLSDSDGESL